jgi:hypothetical protein
MGKVIRICAVFFLLTVIGPSCELLEDCKSCTVVKEDSNGDKTYGATATYCGSELELKETENVTINDITTYYECE